MKNLLAVIGDGNAGQVLEAALLVAKRFNSHIVGLHSLTTEYAVVFGGEMGFSISSEVDRTLEREGHERRDQARRLFREFMNTHGVPIGTVAPGHNGPSASWREEDGRQNAVVGMSGRVYDLIVVEQPEKLASIAEATLEDALFESGRPVLIAPPTSPRSLATNILVAWNQSTEQARTMADAMPFLSTAQRITILTVEGATVAGPSGEQMARSLAMNGIEAETMTLKPSGKRSAGETILTKAEELGCDLIIKGAYTQSRLRQMIFGGTTRHILANAKIPVLMAH